METKNTAQQPAKKVIINDHTSFKAWEKSLHKFSLNNETRSYAFNLPEYSFYENLSISTEVDYYANACGCKTGSFLMSFTFVATIANYFILGGAFSTLTVYHILSLIGITIAGALTGKAIGLLNAHWNLIKIARSIQQRLYGGSVYTLKSVNKLHPVAKL